MSSSVPCAPSNSRLLPACVRVVQTARYVGDHRLQTVGVAEHRVERLLEVDRGGAQVLREHEVVEVEVFAQRSAKATGSNRSCTRSPRRATLSS